jgi:hypothetical protein
MGDRTNQERVLVLLADRQPRLPTSVPDRTQAHSVAEAHFFPFLDAAERELDVTPPLFRVGFLAALRVDFFATAAAALLAFRLGGCFEAEAFFAVFFFGGVDASFVFRFVVVVRFLAAPIAAPESAPITVPTTGSPRAVPATAPATAPPRALPVVPVALSAASSFLSSSMFLSRS